MVAKIKSELIVEHLTEKQLLQKLKIANIQVSPLIKKALLQAKKTHEGIKRMNGSSYLNEHIYPLVVDMIDYCKVNKIKINDVIISSVILHDVIEDDINLDKSKFKKDFGNEIFNIVMSVTKPAHCQNVSQEEMFVINTQFWESIQKSGRYGIIIKLLDKLNNNSSDLTIIDKFPAKVQRDIDEIEELYIPYTQKNDRYLYVRFKKLAFELKKALKAKHI